MKRIVIFAKNNCIACQYVEETIAKLCKNKNIEVRVAYDLKPDDKVTIFPTISFYKDKIEVARISSTLSMDFYQVVIDNFETL